MLTLEEQSIGGLMPVGRFEDLASAREYALVVLAMNLDCLIRVHEDGYVIHADAAFHEAIKEEFRLYSEEQQISERSEVIPVFGSGINVILVWISALLLCFAKQSEDPSMEDRYLSSSLGIVENGEWYRAFTSLFLHADLEHLMGNVLFGVLFGVFVSLSFGSLRGWALVLLSGFLGNLLSVAIQYPREVYSLGASTAVFGALGLLVGSGVVQIWRQKDYRAGMKTLVPIMAGVMIFSLNGIGKPGTDTLAHLTGMFSGMAVGLVVSFLSIVRPREVV